jgi:hypothetical protein
VNLELRLSLLTGFPERVDAVLFAPAGLAGLREAEGFLPEPPGFLVFITSIN